MIEDRASVELRALCDRTPGLAAALGRILDRRDRDGRLPRRVTLDADPAVADALAAALSRRAIADAGEGRIRVDLAVAARALGEDGERRLEAILYAATARAPRDLAAEERAVREALGARVETIASGAAPRTAAARAFLAAERELAAAGRGETVTLAREAGTDAAAREVALLARAIDGVLENRAPIRIQAFAARVLGSSKALGAGSDRLRRLGAALWDHDPATRARIQETADFATLAAAQAEALDVHGIYRDVAAASALCFGPLVYLKGRERFDHVARHAARGECVRLVQHQLRDAELERPAFPRVTLIENLTPFLDYCDALAARTTGAAELAIHTGGHASWAVIALLRLIAPYAIPVRHAGDLDRSGVVIARDLARRAGLRDRLVLAHMDPATHVRFRTRGRALRPAERERLTVHLAADPPDALGHKLLREIHATGVWIEQEAFSDETLIGDLSSHDDT